MKFSNSLVRLVVFGAGSILCGGALAAEAPTGPLDVDEAVRIALRQNYAHRQAQAGVGVAEGSRLDALAGILPRASGDYTYSKSKSTSTYKDILVYSQSVNGAVTDERFDNLDLDSEVRGTSYGVSVSQDLSLSGWYNYRSAQARVQSARYGQAASAQDLAFQVRQQFYLVLRAQDLLQVQTEDLRLAQDQERRITSMFELGSVARVDVLKAKVRVSEADLALIRQQNTVDIERARLATLLGFDPAADLSLSGDLKGLGAPMDSAGAVAEAVGRPDLGRAREDLRSASDSYRAALLSRVPGLFANFDWGASTGTRIADNYTQQKLTEFDVPAVGDTTVTSVLFVFPTDSDRDDDGWNLRVGARVSLDAFLNMGQHKRARSLERQAQYQLEGLELDVQREIEEAILNFNASLKAIEAAESGVVSAEEDLRLSQERYQQGLGTVLELLEAQVAVTRARNNLVNAQTGLKISEAALDKARGAPLPS